ncbi:MAG: FMN-binding negative transcriptional regulator [Pseudomonadota bacterium]
MYRPGFYDCQDLNVVRQIMEHNPFATLVSNGESLLATHLPLLAVKNDDADLTLVGHLARQNPQAQTLQGDSEVLCIFSGADAYISPRWYKDEEDVPTWNYSAVHAYGRPSILESHSATRGVLSSTVDHFESDFDHAWSLDALHEGFLDQLQSDVIAFTISISRLECATKLGQDKSTDDRRRVSEGLTAQPSSKANEVAADMLDLLGETPNPRR